MTDEGAAYNEYAELLDAKDERSPAKFDAFVKAEIARWSPILKAAAPAN